MSNNIATVYLGGTTPNFQMMSEIHERLKKRYNIVNVRGQNIEDTLMSITNADLAIFIMVKREFPLHFSKSVFALPVFDRADTKNVLVELGISVGSGIQTVVVGKAEKLAILKHPWVRTFSFQEILGIIASDTDLTYIPPTRINEDEEKERADRLQGL